MHLASMLQVNDTLKELELADCDLVNTHRVPLSTLFGEMNFKFL